jgi:rRNA maturation RNase YbeY
MPSVHFFQEDINFKLPHPRKTTKWIKAVVAAEGGTTGVLNYIFCSDRVLSQLNTRYLRHKTLTDIITFDTADGQPETHGEIYISIDRIKDNAAKFNEPFDRELHRVMIHGILHLLGYGDKTDVKRRLMRKKEDAYLSLRH